MTEASKAQETISTQRGAIELTIDSMCAEEGFHIHVVAYRSGGTKNPVHEIVRDGSHMLRRVALSRKGYAAVALYRRRLNGSHVNVNI